MNHQPITATVWATAVLPLASLYFLGAPCPARAQGNPANPGKASAAIQAKLDALAAEGEPVTPFAAGEEGDLTAAFDRERGLTVYLASDGASESYEEIRQLAREAGVEAYGFSEQLGSFELTAVTPSLLLAIDTREDILYFEEGGQLAADLEITPFNADAQDTHEVGQLRQRHGVSGAGMTAGVWDGGLVLAQHVEFQGRVRAQDSGSPGSHATHVAGTIAAKGEEPAAQGMAPEATLHSYDWYDDLDELAVAVGAGVAVSNHSYGRVRGWYRNRKAARWEWHGDPTVDPQEDYRFGKYGGLSRAFDQVARTHPGLTIFKAAGNDRNDDPRAQPGWNGKHWVPAVGKWSSDSRRADGFDDGGFDTLGDVAVAKNVITVGAIEDITGHRPRPEDVRVTSFSGWGPTDDGRVKPDLVANGADLYSPTVKRKLDGSYYLDQYVRMPGTSMATPVASGIAVLLNELAVRQRTPDCLQPSDSCDPGTLHSDELKAVLIHTAMSPNPGPSYRTGWGSPLADRAGDVVAGEAGVLLRNRVTDGGFEWRGEGRAGRSVRVTLVWIDPPGSPNLQGLDDRTPVLVHDLDLLVTSPGGDAHYPWSLDPERPAMAATRNAPNRVDNVERVDVAEEDVVDGVWKVTVSAPAAAEGQEFALVIGGLEGE